MKPLKPLILGLSIMGLLGASLAVQAAGNWKKGRIYYRMVCTACHANQAGGSIAPSIKTKAEWGAYLDADSHAKGKDKVSYYISQEYRKSIADSNRAAKKFLKVPNDVLAADVRAFVIHGAKDSDTPARCN